MNRLSNYYRCLLLFLTVLFGAGSAYGQSCDIQLTGFTKQCTPWLGSFSYTNTSGKTVTGVEWNFGDGTKSTQDNPTKSYSKPGTYKVTVKLTFSDGTTCDATFGQDIHAFDHPKAVLNLTGGGTPTVQCYSNGSGILNNFCFTQSSTVGKDGAPIAQYIWLFGDGDSTIGKSVCHSYDSAGTYSVCLKVIDTNGCEDQMCAQYAIRVLPDIRTKFTINGKDSCGKSTYFFKNATDTVGAFITNWEWDFGDGSPVNTTTWSPKHTYTKEGKFTVKLKVYNKLGCSATYTAIAKNTKPKIEITFKDTVCWKNNSVAFSIVPIDDAYALWNFDDIPSGPLNTDIYTWTSSHKFTSPKTYNVKIKVFHNVCGEIDTCIRVHIMGPQAAIPMPQLPPPLSNANDYVAAKPMPKSEFLTVNAANNCQAQKVAYSYFVSNGTKTVTKYRYCNAPVLNQIHDTVKRCYDVNEPYIAGVVLKPTDSTVTIVKDSIEIIDTFKKGDDITKLPKKVYYPSHGQKLWPQMPDTDLYDCFLPNNIVHFSNYTVKYRLHEALDNDPLAYLNWDFPEIVSHADTTINGKKVKRTVFGNWFPLVFENGWKDSCKNKNYPYASDSLQYLWSFSDPSGVKCTSTVSGIDWGTVTPIPNTKATDCNFSTLPSPYHNFKATTPPPGGCQTVTLGVWDPVVKCGDTATLQLKVGPPNAWYDRAYFCTMTWEMQQFTTQRGQAGVKGRPLRGFIMDNKQNCTGNNYKFRLDLSEVIPVCGPQNYWLVFDSAAATKVACTYGGHQYLDYGFLGSANKKGWPIGAPKKVWENIPWNGKYWYMSGDSGCKTIGVVIQNGDCFDTAWYHDYICFNKLSPSFDVVQRDTVVGGGGVKTVNHTFVGSSAGTRGYLIVGHREPYPYNTSLVKPMGVDLELMPHDTNMTRVTYFAYAIARREFPAGDWYYERPFWPDTAELNPFVDTREDSITSVQDSFVLLADSQVYYYLGGIKSIVPTQVYLKPAELQTLNSQGKLTLKINDWRGRYFSFSCADTISFFPVNGKACAKSISKILRISDPRKDNTTFRPDGIPEHDTVSFHLPYPGFYTVLNRADNLDGCSDFSSMHIIYGHFAKFHILGDTAHGKPMGDSIICVNDTVRFEYMIRYWTNLCPPGPGGTPPPDGCIDGVIDNGLGPYGGILSPWENIPYDPSGAKVAAYRQSLLDLGIKGKWKGTGGFKQERVYFNYGDGTVQEATGQNYGATPHFAFHQYKKPGVYTVTMISYDSLGYAVYTIRKKFIKVIDLKPGFRANPVSDTLNYCAPAQVTFKDTTTFVGSEVNVPRKFGYLMQKLDSQRITLPAETLKVARIVACQLKIDDSIVPSHIVWKKILAKDTLYADSILTTTWYPGNGDRITRLNTDTLTFNYPHNGVYDVRMDVRSANIPKPCSAGASRAHYIHILGPVPNFELVGPTEGCAPFRATVRNINDTSRDYQWTWGDSNISGSKKFDDTIRHTYTDTGLFTITVLASDSVHDAITNKNFNCSVSWPYDDDSIKFQVRVWPHSKLNLGPDRPACKGESINLKASSKYDEYVHFKWDLGDGRILSSDNANSPSFSYDHSGVYTVIVRGTSAHNCGSSDTLTITVDSVKADFTVDTTYGKIAKFGFTNTSTNAVKYKWDFGDGSTKETTDMTPFYHVYSASGLPAESRTPSSTSYRVSLVAYSKNGCVDSTDTTVVFNRQWQHYNVITPNGDGVNDVFNPTIKGETAYEMQIFNRWGEKVFESNSKDKLWDGTDMGGKACAAGTYFYIWKFTLIGAPEKTITGTVTIVREQ